MDRSDVGTDFRTSLSETGQLCRDSASRELFARVTGRFFRAETRRRARTYVQGLLTPLETKNGRTLAMASGERRPDGMQRLLTEATWDVDGVRDDVRTSVSERFANEEGIFVIGETTFVKNGQHSAGVERQCIGRSEVPENCQVGVFLAYATGDGCVLVDRELYLPRSWTDNPRRRSAAAVPASVGYASPSELARVMLARAVDAGVPGAWVSVDLTGGADRDLRDWLQRRHLGYVAAMPIDQPIPHGTQQVSAADLVAGAPNSVWKRWPGRAWGRSGLWAVASPRTPLGTTPKWASWLLAGREPEALPGEELTCHHCWGPAGTTDGELVEVASAQLDLADRFRLAKASVGLGDYQVRRYDAWYRHITLAMLADAHLALSAATDSAASTGSAVPGDLRWHT
ncbi:IS701 family transposase [Kutzneria albida]|uniref:Transposase n=1 Tax=Kutzneria albida DSM 43870 TaxID=1449976 RepID=W5W9I3_9PSEU|nr:IS701 family transposase [Kutzneria albida]AHH94859.1 transposase [Kutzneria albida DSM 43870]